MKFLLLVAAVVFSSSTFAGPDEAKLKGDPLGHQTLEVASILLQHRDELANLFADTLGTPVRFWKGTIQTSIQNNAVTTTYTLPTQKCDLTGSCVPMDNLIIEKVETQGKQGLDTVFKPFTRLQGHPSGIGLPHQVADVGSIFLDQREQIAKFYSDKAALGTGQLRVFRAVENIKRDGTTRTTTYDFEVQICADFTKPHSCYWLNTLTIVEEATQNGKAVNKKYKFSVKGSGLG